MRPVPIPAARRNVPGTSNSAHNSGQRTGHQSLANTVSSSSASSVTNDAQSAPGIIIHEVIKIFTDKVQFNLIYKFIHILESSLIR